MVIIVKVVVEVKVMVMVIVKLVVMVKVMIKVKITAVVLCVLVHRVELERCSSQDKTESLYTVHTLRSVHSLWQVGIHACCTNIQQLRYYPTHLEK